MRGSNICGSLIRLDRTKAPSPPRGTCKHPWPRGFRRVRPKPTQPIYQDRYIPVVCSDTELRLFPTPVVHLRCQTPPPPKGHHDAEDQNTRTRAPADRPSRIHARILTPSKGRRQARQGNTRSRRSLRQGRSPGHHCRSAEKRYRRISLVLKRPATLIENVRPR